MTFLEEGPRYTPQKIAAQQSRTDWLSRVASAHTLPRELRTVRRYTPNQKHLASPQMPTLLLLGSESPPLFRQAIEMLQNLLPQGTTAILQGQHHNATETSPAQFVEAVHRFCVHQSGV